MSPFPGPPNVNLLSLRCSSLPLFPPPPKLHRRPMRSFFHRPRPPGRIPEQFGRSRRLPFARRPVGKLISGFHVKYLLGSTPAKLLHLFSGVRLYSFRWRFAREDSCNDLRVVSVCSVALRHCQDSECAFEGDRCEIIRRIFEYRKKVQSSLARWIKKRIEYSPIQLLGE